MSSSVAEPDAKPVSVGIIGLGRAGRHHLERLSIRDDFRVATIFDLDTTRCDPLRHLTETIAPSWDELLRDPQIELLLLATPPATHAVLACEALHAGKQVVLHPPFCLTAADADRMTQAARATGRLLSVAHTRRYEDDFQLAWQSHRRRTLGPLRSALYIARDQAPLSTRCPSTPGDRLLWEMGSHVLDQLLLLAESPPVRVALLEPNDLPAAPAAERTLHLEFASGLVATLHFSRSSRAPLHTGWVLHGDTGDYANGIEYTTAPDGELIDVPVTLAPPAAADYYRDLFQHLRLGTPAPCPAAEARRIVAVIEALQHSAERQQFVTIPSVPS